MSVLIKGIKVHRGDCWECPCLDGEYGECNVLEKDVRYIDKADCPLIELPDHGRLVDVDEMERMFLKATGISISFNGVPAVIPAERDVKVCPLHSDDEVTEYCLEGPCTDEMEGRCPIAERSKDGNGN